MDGNSAVMDESTVQTEIEALKRNMAVQGATQAGAQATQAATQAGAQATQAATQAGQAATQAASVAGLSAAAIAGATGFVIGMFLGIAVAKSK